MQLSKKWTLSKEKEAQELTILSNKVKSLSKQDLNFENGILRERARFLSTNRHAALWELIVRWVGRSVIAWIIFKGFIHSVGKRTEIIADLGLDVNGGVTLGLDDPVLLLLLVIAAVISVSAILYGYRQRQLRGIAIEQMSMYRQKYEALIDPNRSSSGLTAHGNTREEDK